MEAVVKGMKRLVEAGNNVTITSWLIMGHACATKGLKYLVKYIYVCTLFPIFH